MHIITLAPTGYRVDADDTTVKTIATWSSDTRERSGMPADRVMVQLFATAHESNGRQWPCLVDVWESDAVSNARRERVIKELQAVAAAAIAELKGRPAETLVVDTPVAAKPVRAPAGAPGIPTPSSNNDEIARAIVKKASYDAAELGQANVEAVNVQSSFEAYVAKHSLSEKRANGIREKIAAIGHTW